MCVCACVPDRSWESYVDYAQSSRNCMSYEGGIEGGDRARGREREGGERERERERKREMIDDNCTVTDLSGMKSEL